MVTTNNEVPLYDELPIFDKIGMPHSWDYFGREDELGALNFLTPEVKAAAASEVRVGVSVSLNLPMRQPNPPLFGREPFDHQIFSMDRNSWDDKLDGYYPQSSTQWDGFRHVRAREFGFFGGRTGNPNEDLSWLGIDKWAKQGIVGRGVLVDVEAYLQRNGQQVPFDEEFAITPELIDEILTVQGVTKRRGDILLVRTAWSAKKVSQGNADIEKIPGVHAGEETARYLWNWGIAALATDTPAVEPVPGDPAVGSLHRRLLPLLGIPLGELFDLEELSVQCHKHNTFSFLFTSAPLNLEGGTGSPANAVAIL